MKNRILVALALIVIALGMAFAIYWVFFRAPIVPIPPRAAVPTAPATTLPVSAPGVSTTPGGVTALPGAAIPPASKIAQGGPTTTTQLTETPVKSAVLSSDGQSLAYYNTQDNKFYRVGSDGKPTLLSDKSFFNIEKINWAPGAKRAVLEYPDGTNTLYDFEKNQQVTLPKHWEGFSFSPQGDHIVAKSVGIDPSNRWLVTANADGSGAQAIEPLGENQDKVIASWSPNDQVIAFGLNGAAQGFDTSEVYLVGKNHENFKSLTVEGRDFRPAWTPDGARILYSVYNSDNNFNPLLWIVDGQGDAIGGNRHSIGLATWADKCTFSDATTAYCGVPRELPEGAGLQPSLVSDSPDLVYRVDVASGTKTFVGAPADGANITAPRVSADGRFLFFVDGRTGLLRQMQIK